MVFLLAYCISLLCRTKVINQIYSGHSLGRSGHPYTPPPGSVPGDADRSTLCPMGSRCPGLNVAFLDAFGSDQGSIKAFNTSSIRQTQICSIDYLDLLYIMHKFNCYICAYLLNNAMSTAFRSVCSSSAYISTILWTFHAVTTLAFPSLEAPEHPCTCLRSAALSVVVCPAAVLLALALSQPFRKLLLQRISSWHLCRSDY